MFEFLLFIQFFIGLFMINSQSPLFMSLLIIGLSFFQGMLSFFLFSKWVGLSLIMIFMGGMMVIFLYVSSLSSNNKFIINEKLFMSIMILSTFLLVILFISPMNFSTINMIPASTYIFFNSPIMLFMVSYLLMTLFISTKIAESFKGSLIQKF